MRCFAHTDREAIAICRICSKGLCAECGESAGRGLVCRGECAEWGHDYDGFLQEALENYRKRMQHQKEFEKQQREGPGTSIKLPRLPDKPPGPTMSERASAHRTVALAAAKPIPPAISPWQRTLGLFHLLVGCLLVLWGFVDLERFLFVLFLGLVFVCFGVGLLVGRTKQRIPATTTVNTEQKK
jgi:hypothetical protein